MEDWVELIGSSGKRYRYVAAPKALPPAGGNFALVRDPAGGRGIVVEIGQADVLATGAADAQATARQRHDEGVRLFIRLSVSGAARREELAGLKAALESSDS